MKIFKKITAIALALTLSLSAIPSFGNIEDNGTLNDEITEMQEYPFYYSFTGIVKEITEKVNGNTMVLVESKDSIPANFVLTENTYYVDEIKIEEGMEIIGFYEANKPMIMIYPPQYSIDIVACAPETLNIKADKFNSDLVSKDNNLKLNLCDDIEIIWENGTAINWIKKPTIEELSTVLANRKLVVFYDISTRSIPAQTTPKKIIVLSQQIDDSAVHIIVNDNIIEAPLSYINEEKNIMVPVRAISEALGYKVTWNNDNRGIQIGEQISFKIGENTFNIAGKDAVELETNSVIKDGNTFVPLSFYTLVLNVLTADMIDNNIIINTK
ncbi:MAG: stalk domain-containing protein [Tissierellia bacterium]|nr:stalk domain-containing protein [Tissierellia bacterium]MDD4779309.1 stalk domain-containing protein [Tissierellia bacterium]